MANTESTQPSGSAEAALEGGSYEVLRRRLQEQADVLAEKCTRLNERRQESFGGVPMSIIGNDRIRTENNCVPQDMVQVEGKLLFGYNVFVGLRKETRVSDVFALHKCEQNEDGSFDLSAIPVGETPAGLLRHERFVREFEELYRYSSNARLALIRRTESRLLAVFSVGSDEKDIRVFRWGLDGEGHAEYMDNRGDRDHVFPPSHDFEWITTGREQQVRGTHPHVNILDEVFVEAVGGDLTVKIENNSEDGQGIYAEPVDDPSQGLDDGKIDYAKVGRLILIRILPFREEKWRYLVFNARTKQVLRVDGVGQSCISLPEDQGIIFPGGYYLQTGDYRLFDTDISGLRFKRAIRSPNGEDVLYVFHRSTDGHYLLFPYNVVRQEVQNLINCHGFSLFPDGKLIVFRATSDNPGRVHPVQIWQTPFYSAEIDSLRQVDDSFIGRVGNAELVRGISDCFTVCRMAKADDSTRETYEDLVSQVQRTLDSYYWLSGKEIDDLADSLKTISHTTGLIIDEYEKVVAMRSRAVEALEDAENRAGELLRDIRPDTWERIDDFLNAMTRLRLERGHLITVRDIRYIDIEKIESLEKEVADSFDEVCSAAVEFLLESDAFGPMKEDLERLLERISGTELSIELKELTEKLDELTEGLTLLGETIGGLEVGDPTARTRILQDVSEVFSLLNRVRATLQNRRQELLGREGRVEFGAQFALFGQTVESALALCDEPDKCDEQLSRVLVTLEELESRFADFEEFAGKLNEKREEVYEVFTGRKQQLREARQRRAANMASAADRIFQGIERRTKSFKDQDQLNAFFASDPMVQRLRSLIRQLMELDDPVRADEISGRLQSARQNAMRTQRDRADLFEGGENVVRFGTHRFNVSTEEVELTMVPRGEGMALHLSGTDFYENIDDPELDKTRDYWNQQFVSETPEVYRSEYLASKILFGSESGREGLSIARLNEAYHSDGGLLALVRSYAADKYEEGYDRGVHDADAARILEKLITLRETVGLLRYAPSPRALACLYWALLKDDEERAGLARRAASLGRLRHTFKQEVGFAQLGEELGSRIDQFFNDAGIEHGGGDVMLSGRYLAEELSADNPRFITAGEAVELRDGLWKYLEQHGLRASFEEDLAALKNSPKEALELLVAWFKGLLKSRDGEKFPEGEDFILEASVIVLTGNIIEREISSARTRMNIEGLLGRHPRIQDGKILVRIEKFLRRLAEFIEVRAPGYYSYRKIIASILERERKRLRLDELKPKVLTSFVRNQLIDEVYLPLIGGNLAKQLGSAGEDRRTDQSGLLLLISPPGYGKTTLMEYVAGTLGLIFVKVNGPSLGHSVTSLDPSEAPNATAKQEVEKINLALEMSNNVLLYLDDIQHTNSELLQKFISLCDAQRRIEGVWNNRTRTYDLRGKRFAVVMAGNPYTEAGERFQLPDMLANRADTYNLGDILDGREILFAQSYIENALTSNPVLRPLSGREPADVRRIIRMARGEDVPASELVHNYSSSELEEILAVMRHLFTAQSVLLKVNAEYIRSAGQDDRYRTEPPFKLQGSYRNMARLAERIVSAMNTDEVEILIDDHYMGESQTLTSGAEQNLLKLAELRDRMSAEQAERWAEIKRGYARHQIMGSKDEDPMVRALGQLASLTEQVGSLRDVVSDAANNSGANDEISRLLIEMEEMRSRDNSESSKRLAELQVKAMMESARMQADEQARSLKEAAKIQAEAQIQAARLQAGALAESDKTQSSSNAHIQAKFAGLLGKQLEQIEKALLSMAGSVVSGKSEISPSTHADLSAVLDKLAEAMTAMASRKVELEIPPEAFSALMMPSQMASEQQDSSIGSSSDAGNQERCPRTPPPLPSSRPPGYTHQLRLIQDALMPLRQISRRQLREGDGKINALQVWRQINEALQIVQAAALRKD